MHKIIKTLVFSLRKSVVNPKTTYGRFLPHKPIQCTHSKVQPYKFPIILSICNIISLLSPFKKEPNPNENYQLKNLTINNYEVEKNIAQLIRKAEELTIKNKLDEAKVVLENALKLTDSHQAYGNIAYIYDLLTSIAFKRGSITEAEDMLANFIEKLQQIGYPEDHNTIIKFKLKLSRLYQLVGNHHLAEFGYRDCINAQEKKMNRSELDEDSNVIYISCLFWYAKMLEENHAFIDAKSYMKKVLGRIEKSTSITASQKMVVLYTTASLADFLEQYDEALEYLYEAIDICLANDKDNPEFPLYIILVGNLHTKKGLYDVAKYWCEVGKSLAIKIGNAEGEAKACQCLEDIEKIVDKKRE